MENVPRQWRKRAHRNNPAPYGLWGDFPSQNEKENDIMKLSSKIIAVACVAALALSLVACGGNETTTSSSAAASTSAAASSEAASSEAASSEAASSEAASSEAASSEAAASEVTSASSEA